MALIKQESEEMKIEEVFSLKQEDTEKQIEAATITGDGSMKKRQELIITTVNEKKQDMFNKAKHEVLKKFNNLKLYIKKELESGLKKSIKLLLSQSSKITLMDVSREIEQLESLSEQ